MIGSEKKVERRVCLSALRFAWRPHGQEYFTAADLRVGDTSQQNQIKGVGVGV